MAPKNRVGTFSLVIAATGFFVLEAAHMLAGLEAPAWTLVRSGFEAAVIGGLADWFAVRALFRAIPAKPLPPLPHTNLVVTNRQKLTDGLVDLVEHQLLSPTTLNERLGRFSASRLLIAKLESENGQAAAVNALLAVAERLALDLADDEKTRAVLAEAIRAELRDADLALVVGAWLLRRVEVGDTRKAWMWAAHALADEADAGSFDSVLTDALNVAIARVRDENLWRGTAFSWFISPRHDIRHVRTAVAEILREQATNPRHAWNEQLDAAVTQLARRLLARDTLAATQVKKLQEHLAASLDVDSLVTHVATDLHLALEESARDRLRKTLGKC